VLHVSPPPMPPPTAVPYQSPLPAARMYETPRVDHSVHISTITECTGIFTPTSKNCYIRSDGQVMFIDPRNGEHSPVTGTLPPGLIAAITPPPPRPPTWDENMDIHSQMAMKHSEVVSSCGCPSATSIGTYHYVTSPMNGQRFLSGWSP
jgi:hypothetical protein